jgi:hypothetical protein
VTKKSVRIDSGKESSKRPNISELFSVSKEISKLEGRVDSKGSKKELPVEEENTIEDDMDVEELEETIRPAKQKSTKMIEVKEDPIVVQEPYQISEDINTEIDGQFQRRVLIKEFMLEDSALKEEGGDFEELTEDEWIEANFEVKEELVETKKALKLQAYIDWIVEKTAAISDKNLDDMTRDIATMKELASKLPKITEEELEARLFLRRFEYLIELSGISLRPMISNCPSVLSKMIQQKLSRIHLGEFCGPTPYSNLYYQVCWEEAFYLVIQLQF